MTARALVAEGFGSCLLVATVVGSGLMATAMTGDQALALLANALATGAVLIVLISLLAPVSGAHLNPAVTLVFALRRAIRPGLALGYVAAQIMGAVAGTLLAHAMFGLPLVQIGETVRTGGAQWLAEGVASFGLIAVILGGLHRADLPRLVALYIVGAYWFTASTSFANPAVTIARSLTNSFAGIRPQDVPGFALAQVAGALLAAGFAGWLFRGNPRD
ncbi:aquaporin [Fuscibacter oryzae]|uniref:Aquaporin n=1 Tax=Fuscibacter oryzae TaxID=2803939 RepID=A0A8J7MLS3_9RHOB|nr:aquaporin [Fuscibacter oryzae]MBL4926502.1 aquaporin [Fuscibacter oryzae]